MIEKSAGTKVSVSYGGDEDTVTFVFDAAGSLIVAHWSNQSPEATWFCGVDVRMPNEPDAECVGTFISMSHRAGSDFTCAP